MGFDWLKLSQINQFKTKQSPLPGLAQKTENREKPGQNHGKLRVRWPEKPVSQQRSR